MYSQCIFGKPRQIPIAIATFRTFPEELGKAPRMYYGGAHLKVTDRKALSFFFSFQNRSVFFKLHNDYNDFIQKSTHEPNSMPTASLYKLLI